MKRLFFSTILLIGTFFSALYSQSAALPVSKKSIFTFLENEGPLPVTIVADFQEIIVNKNKIDDYLEGELRINRDGATPVEMPVKLKPRGKFRRKVCDFPPLKLKFRKKDLAQMDLDTFNNLKLVTHCKDEVNDDDEALLREYLAYKMFNRLTGASFRVQLLNVTYVDKSGQRAPETRLALLIEDDEELAHRLGGSVCECFNTPAENFDSYQSALVTLFNYMIGNPDFDATMLRNMKIIQPLQGGAFKMVPYDFDFSGFVHPSYIKGYSTSWLKEARENVNLGAPVSEAETVRLKSHFLENKDYFFQLLKEDKMLSKKTKRRLSGYLDSFYDELEQSAILPAGAIPASATLRAADAR